MTKTTIAATKANFDASTDDPKQARAEFASNVDAFNALVAQSFIGAAVTATALPTNLNTATDPSWYYAFRSSHTNGPAWSGGSVDWLLRTFRYSAAYHYQFLYALTTGGVLYSWTRYNNNGSWSAWQQNAGPNTATLSALSLQSGDLIFALASGVLSRLGLGTPGQALLVSSESPSLPEWGDIISGIGGVNIQTFTASGTYTPTSGYTWALAFVTGGGGGGGGADTSGSGGDASGGGGGGGATAIGILDLSSITSETVTIGAAGTAGSTAGGNGGAGGNSSLGALLTANGGSGGTGSGANVTMDVENNGGAGSSTTGGTALAFTVNGSSGGDSDNTSGYGGGTLWGQGGPAQWFASNSTNTGVAGSVYGSGGSGGTAEDNSGSASAAGGAGAAGVVFILEFK